MLVSSGTVAWSNINRYSGTACQMCYVSLFLPEESVNMIIVYGIPNCDTIKKTIKWLEAHKQTFVFHDYRKEGISREMLKDWSRQVGWEILLNKRSTTWKELDAAVQATATNETNAIRVMQQHPTLIKRPVITKNGKVVAVGFNESEMSKTFGR